MITVILLNNKTNQQFEKVFYCIENANKFINKLKYSKKITYLGMEIYNYD